MRWSIAFDIVLNVNYSFSDVQGDMHCETCFIYNICAVAVIAGGNS